MKIQSPDLWWLRIATFVLAAMAAASAVYWVLKWSAGSPTTSVLPVAHTLLRAAQTDPQEVARLLGGGQKAVVAALSDSAASRFKLVGVVASSSSRGYALISIDGKPARPYGVGAAVNDSLVVRSVAPRSAALAPSANAPPSFTLELPAPVSVPSTAAASSRIPVTAAVQAPEPAPVPAPGQGRAARSRASRSSSEE
jgi:general secretion pathway protein C